MNLEYAIFREYSLSIKYWLNSLFKLTRLDCVQFNILSLTRVGTTDGGVNQSEIKIDVNMLTLSTDKALRAGQTIKIVGSTQNDEVYSIKKISASGDIVILDEVYRRIRIEQPNPGGVAKRSINVIYGSMDRSIAALAMPMRQGTTDNPGVSFYLSDYSYKIEKSRPLENYYTRRYKDNNSGDIIGVATVPPMQEFEIRYTINIWSVYQQEMDILNYELVSEFAPQKYFWIAGNQPGDSSYGLGYTGDRMDREHHGQWAHSTLESISDASDLEPGDSAQRSLRTEAVIIITNAYSPMPFDNNGSMIGSVAVELENQL